MVVVPPVLCPRRCCAGRDGSSRWTSGGGGQQRWGCRAASRDAPVRANREPAPAAAAARAPQAPVEPDSGRRECRRGGAGGSAVQQVPVAVERSELRRRGWGRGLLRRRRRRGGSDRWQTQGRRQGPVVVPRRPSGTPSYGRRSDLLQRRFDRAPTVEHSTTQCATSAERKRFGGHGRQHGCLRVARGQVHGGRCRRQLVLQHATRARPPPSGVAFAIQPVVTIGDYTGVAREWRPGAALNRNPPGCRDGHAVVHDQSGDVQRLGRGHLRRVFDQRARRGLHALGHRHGRRPGGRDVDGRSPSHPALPPTWPSSRVRPTLPPARRSPRR